MYDRTTAGKAITRFVWGAFRAREVPDDGNDYDDFSYGFSTYNTQMYMGYNDVAGTTGENLRFWEGDASA